MKGTRLTALTAAVLWTAFPGADLPAQTTHVRNGSMGVLQTSSGNSVGFPSKVMLAWPRSEVHKQYGIPSRFLVLSTAAGEYMETSEVEWSFRTKLPVAEFYQEMPGLSTYPLWLYYDIDPTAAKLGVRQRVRSIRAVPPQPVSMWELMESPAASFPEAADLCGGACTLHRIRSDAEDYVLAVPREPTADQHEIGRWVGAGYGSAESAEGWTTAIKLRLARGSWMVADALILAARVDDETRTAPGRQVESIGVWTPK